MSSALKSMQVLVPVFIAIVAHFCHAQVPSKGHNPPKDFLRSQPANEKSIFNLPDLNNAALRLAAEHERPGPWKFGEAINMRIDMQKGDGEWRVDQTHWNTEMACHGQERRRQVDLAPL